jgi:hypothetical protein
MNDRQRLDADPRIEAAIVELKGLIRAEYSDAGFEVVQGEDPEGIYLIATVDVVDQDAVVDCYVERLLELQVTEELPLYVVPVRPLERVLAAQHTHPVRASALAD